MKKKYTTTLLTVLLACPVDVKTNDTADLDDIKLYDIVKKDSNELRSRANALSGENWQQKIDKSQEKIDRCEPKAKYRV